MINMIKEISTNEVFQLLGKPETKIIDIRPIDAYNGWCLQNESRCGHIKGAKSLPAKWIEYIDWIEIVRSKKILPKHKIVVYGYSSAESEKVAKAFLHAGYNDVSIYNQFKFVICHAHYLNRDAYLGGHIPGAIDMDTLALESPETWNRRSPEELKEALERHGITSDTTVILYGKFLFPNNADPFPGSAAGHIGAIRCAFIMMYAGVKDVRVLNGGFQSWLDAGYEINTEDVSKNIVSDFGIPIPANPSLAVDLPEAKELLRSDDGDLVCVRSWSEYIGEVSGY